MNEDGQNNVEIEEDKDGVDDKIEIVEEDKNDKIDNEDNIEIEEDNNKDDITELEEDDNEENYQDENNNNNINNNGEESEREEVKKEEVIITEKDVQKVIKELQNAISKNNSEKQSEACKKLVAYSKIKTNYKKIRNEYGNHLQLFIDLLDSESSEIKLAAIKIINNISKINSIKNKFINYKNFFPNLIKLFSADYEIRQLTLNAIGFLITKNSDNADALHAAGGIEELIKLLSSDEDKIKITFYAAACLWVFGAHGKKYQDIIVEADALPILIPLVLSEDEDVAWQAAGAICNLVVKNKNVHEKFLEENGVDQYLQAIEKYTGDKKYGFDESFRVVHMMLQTFVLISRTESVQPIFRENGFTELLELLPHIHHTHQVHICSIIHQTCMRNIENQDYLSELNAIDTLLEMFDNEETVEPKVRSGITHALWAVTVNNENNLLHLVENEHFDNLIMKMILENDNTLVNIVAILSNVAALSEEMQDLLRERNSIPLLLDILRGTHPPLLEATTNCFMKLMNRNPQNIAVAKQWDCPLLLARLLTSVNNGVKENVVGALRILLETQDEQTIQAIELVNGYKPLLFMMKEMKFPQLQLNASCCVYELCRNHIRFRKEFEKKNIHLGLACVLKSGKAKLLSVAADIICELAPYSEPLRLLFGEEDAVKYLVDLVLESSNLTYVKKGIGGLWALAINTNPHKQIIKMRGGLLKIVEYLVKDGIDEDFIAISIRAIASICSNNYQNQELVRSKPDSVKFIVNSLESDNDEIVLYSGLAIWCLALGNSRMQNNLRDCGSIDIINSTLKKYCENDDPSEFIPILINIVGAIATLCYKNSNNRNEFKNLDTKNVLSNNNILSIENETLQQQIKTVLNELK